MINDYFQDRFIPGLCRVWCKTPSYPYWVAMSYPGRGWHDCVAIVEDYLRRFGEGYRYEITTDSDLARPRHA